MKNLLKTFAVLILVLSLYWIYRVLTYANTWAVVFALITAYFLLKIGGLV